MKKSLLSLLVSVLAFGSAQADDLDLWRVINVTSGAYVNLRENPGMESAILEHLAADLVNITVLNCNESGWCLVNVGDRRGWVSKHYIRQMNKEERKKYPHHGKPYRMHHDNASITGQINRAGAPGIEKKKMEPVKEYPKEIHKQSSGQSSANTSSKQNKVSTSPSKNQTGHSQGKNAGNSQEKSQGQEWQQKNKSEK